MDAIFIDHNQNKKLKHELAQMCLKESCLSLLFLMAFDRKYPEEFLTPLLNACTIPVIGGVFPELIFQGQRKQTGVLLIPLPKVLTTQVFDLSNYPTTITNQLEESQNRSLTSDNTLFVFMDSLSENKDRFMDTLFNYFGISTNYLGGGCGSLDFEPFPCIISNTGLHSHAAVIGWGSLPSVLGVAHGWDPITEPIKVTQSAKNEIHSLNWEPAFDLYKKIVEEHSGQKFTDNNFFDIAKSYPLGVAKIDEEMVVRDPFMASGSTLHVVDSVTEGEYIRILHGNMTSLIQGAQSARQQAMDNASPQKEPQAVFCIDCISRVLYMQDDFQQELKTIGSDTMLNGILSIGEVANSGDAYIELYNKTIVVSLW